MKSLVLLFSILLFVLSFMNCTFTGSNDPDDYKSDNGTDETDVEPTVKRETDINAGSTGSSPMYLTEYGGELYFSADDGSSGRELWRYDAVSGSAALSADINVG